MSYLMQSIFIIHFNEADYFITTTYIICIYQQ